MKLKILALVLILLFSALAICACDTDKVDEPDKNTGDSIQSPTEHTCIPVTVPEAKPTCAEAGKTAGSYCSICNKVLVPQKPVAALGHEWDDATCTTPKTCYICDATESDALGHKKVAYETVVATCTTDGQSGGSRCSVCDKVFEKPTITPALGHDEIPHEGKEATCTEGGWKEYFTCSKCDHTSYADIAALGHNESEWIIDEPAKIGADGQRHTECGRCDEMIHTEVIPALVPSEGLSFVSRGNGTCYVNGIGSCTDTEIIIPATSPDGDKVVGIGSLKDCTNATSVIITDTVTYIDSGAFSGCGNLTSITIPDSVRSIGRNAFKNCSGITKKSNGICYVANWAVGTEPYFFFEPNAEFSFPNDTVGIANNAFSTDTMWKIVHIPGSVKHIGEHAFTGCGGLKSVYMGDGVQTIGNYAFSGCSVLSTLSIPDSIKSIGLSSFKNCTFLKYNVKDGINYFGNSSNPYVIAMSADAYIKNAVLPSGVKVINKQAFIYCSYLTSISIPSSVTTIGASAFYGCSALTNVYISDLSAWYSVDFYDEHSNPLYYAPYLYLNGEPVTDLVIPDGEET